MKHKQQNNLTFLQASIRNRDFIRFVDTPRTNFAYTRGLSKRVSFSFGRDKVNGLTRLENERH